MRLNTTRKAPERNVGMPEYLGETSQRGRGRSGRRVAVFRRRKGKLMPEEKFDWHKQLKGADDDEV